MSATAILHMWHFSQSVCVLAFLQVWQWAGNPPVCGGRHRRAEESHRWHQHDQDEHREWDWSREGGAQLPEEEPRKCKFTVFLSQSSHVTVLQQLSKVTHPECFGVFFLLFFCHIGGDGAEESDLPVRRASGCWRSQRSGPVPDHGGSEGQLWEDGFEECRGPQTLAWKSGKFSPNKGNSFINTFTGSIFSWLTPFSLSRHQIADVQVQVSQNTEALQAAQMEISDLSRQIQTLEIELASQQSLVSMHFTCALFFLSSFSFYSRTR